MTAGPDGLMSAPPGTDQDAGSASTIAATVDGAVAAATARLGELEADTRPMGSSLGDVMTLPPHVFSDTSELQGEPGAGPYVAGQSPPQSSSYTPSTDTSGS